MADTVTDFDEFEEESAELSPNSSVRDEIDKILGYAKLDKSDLLTSCQRVHFDQNLDNEEIKLMEIDSNLAGKIAAGERLVIRGETHETVILCTNDATYELKEAETSNSLLISPNLLYPDDIDKTSDEISQTTVCSILHAYYELKPCRPKLKKLKSLLEENPYCGRVEEDVNTKRKLTYDDLVDSIQASEGELQVALQKLEACEMNGFIRLLDFDLLSKIITSIEGLIYEESWSIDKIPGDACCTLLEELYERQAVSHVLKCYGDQLETEPGMFKLNEEKIARFYATMLLRDTGKFHLRDFTETWQQSVPEGMITDLTCLQGLALVDRSCKPEVVWYFPVDNLPEDINERFDALFRAKEKWTLEEITPYIKEFSTEKVTVNALLTKHCRASMLQGVRVYSSRRPV